MNNRGRGGVMVRGAGAALFALMLLGANVGARRAVGPAPAVASGRASLPGDGPRGKLDPRLAARLLTDPSAPISVVLHIRLGGPPAATNPAVRRAEPADDWFVALEADHATATAPLRSDLSDLERAGHIQRLTDLWLADAIAITADPATVRALAGRADVRWISLDGTASSDATPDGPAAPRALPPGEDGVPLWNIHDIRADDVWQRLGIDGSGVTVGIIDSGVDYHHPALQTRYRGYVDGAGRPFNTGSWWCPSAVCGTGSAYPWDNIGHGTHVTGTILGGTGVGVAPGARWVAAMVCPSEEQCISSWIVQAMQWLVDPARPAADRPSVMNGSFVTKTGDDLVYKSAVDNLVAGGVVVVAATGNNPGLVGAPASYPAAIAVGALTDEGRVWRDSGRGLSLGEEVKPEVVAPGVGITSTLPGGGYGRLTGTSMASPHVAGVAALLRQAQPNLTPAEVKDILKRTAVPLTADRVPEPASGWGEVNAYAAVASVTDVGFLKGTVKRAPDGALIPWARVRLAELNGDPLVAVDVDAATGQYEIPIRPGSYLITAEAFTFRSQVRRGIGVVTGQTTTLDFALEPDAPMGTFRGTVKDAATDAQIAADIRIADVPERFHVQADEFTGFSANLPPGTYQLRVERFGYRVVTDTIKIVADTTTTGNYRLPRAPKILLVDGDGWAYRGGAEYVENSLTQLGYLYEKHRVTDEIGGSSAPEGDGPPSAAEMGGYDLVIWSSPFSSPGFVRGANELSAYLSAGGRLLLSGQDALCTDAGTDVATDPCNGSGGRQPYVQNLLYTRVLKDSAATRVVHGAPDGPLAGLTFQLNGPGSMDDQSTPDVLAVTSPLNAHVIATYEGGEGAGVLADVCIKHRAVALGFGFEGIAGAAMRDRVLDRLVAALSAPTPPHRLWAQVATERLMRPAGTEAAYTVTLHSTGSESTQFEVTVEQSTWPTTLWQGGFSAPLTGPIRLGPCEQVPFGVRVAVPANARRGVSDTATIRVRALEGGAEQWLMLHTGTPAPVLVVDGDFFRNSDGRYLAALDALKVPYDVWRLGLFNNNPRLPTTAELAGYPAVVWFTGYDWRPYGSLTLDGQRSLASYLDGGGRLIFSSEDYLMSRGATPYKADRLFHQDYLGVSEYLQDQGAAHQGPLAAARGAIFEPLGACGLPPLDPDKDFSDRLTPKASSRSALLDALGGTVATQTEDGPFKTVFMAFDAGQLDPACAETVMARALDWFSPLFKSRLTTVPETQHTYGGGDTIHLKLSLANRGPRAVPVATVRWHIPVGANPNPDHVPPGWLWNAGERVLTWTGALALDQAQEQTLDLTMDADLTEHTTLTSYAEIDDGLGLPLTRRVTWLVNAADLSTSSKAVHGAQTVQVGDQASFVVAVVNTGNRTAGHFVVTDTLPTGLVLVPGSVAPASGSQVDLTTVPGGIVWRGSVEPGRTASLAYDARVTTYNGGLLRNRALLDDGNGELWTLSAQVFAQPNLLLPILMRQADPDP